MNREIKFRAWYTKDKKMTFSDQTNWGAFGDCEMSDAQSGSCHLMQFTGLKDTIGREIYEGDILISVEGTVVFVVEFGECEEGLAAFYFKNKKGRKYAADHSIDTMCVCGNIYQNPELLKEKEAVK